MTNSIDNKVLTIQDFSSLGQCSTSVALPIISAMGIETVALPIALLSTHTSNFKGYTYVDLQDNILPSIRHIKSLGVNFDYIYVGYLGKCATASAVEEVCKLFPEAKLIVDPAMAEDGQLYDAITGQFVEKIVELCKKSLICLPNLSEACMLAGEDYSPVQSKESILNICEKLRVRGIDRFVITGIRMIDKKMRLAFCDGDKVCFVDTTEVEGHFFGCGDVFASTLTGALANDLDVAQSIDLAATYTQRTVEVTSKDKAHWYGLKFEKTIPYLIQLLEKAKVI